ncbi:MAG: transposase [Kofleriaceae bacterium]
MRKSTSAVQQLGLAVDLRPRKLDRNGQRRGGARKNAGRPQHVRGPGTKEPHQKRKRVRKDNPLHVVLRTVSELGSFRNRTVLAAIRAATFMATRYEETFRIVEYSIQDNHIHLLVEAQDQKTLAAGMKAFESSCSKRVNAYVSKARGYARRRRGSVFRDRYFATELATPKQLRNTLAYILNNWRKHQADRTTQWQVDLYSSALTFAGWSERNGAALAEDARVKAALPKGYDSLITSAPRTYLIRVLWKRHHPLISFFEVPGGGSE